MKRALPRRNLAVSAALFLVYTVFYLIGRAHGGAIPFPDYFQAAGSLLLLAGLLGWWMERPYYLGLVLFAMAAQFGGTMLRLYAVIPCYDLALHTCSGALLVLLGHFLLARLASRAPDARLPVPVVYAFCWFFSVAWAGIWEIFEFLLDLLLPGNCSQIDLFDTMTDLCAGTAGAFAGLPLLRLLRRRTARKSA